MLTVVLLSLLVLASARVCPLADHEVTISPTGQGSSAPSICSADLTTKASLAGASAVLPVCPGLTGLSALSTYCPELADSVSHAEHRPRGLLLSNRCFVAHPTAAPAETETAAPSPSAARRQLGATASAS